MVAIKKLLMKIVTFALAASMTSNASADYTVNMHTGATVISHEVFNLHMMVFWICVAIGAVVFGIMIYSMIMHRKSRGVKPADFHSNLTIEIIWGVIPFVILIFMAVPATKTLMRINDTEDAQVNIKITGFQWKWRYEYVDEGISFFSVLSTPQDQIQGFEEKDKWYLLEVDKPLVVPIHKKVRFLLTANDVLHSWWVPAFGIKKDAIPGFITEIWAKIEKPGIYRGQCAELCGQGHGFMPIVVEAKTEEDYQKWLNEQKQGIKASQASADKTWTKNELMEKGKSIYMSTCAVCHKPDGTGMPPVFPAMKGSLYATGDVSKHIDIVLRGKEGTAMQAFGGQMSDADIAAVITYERNAFGNDALNVSSSNPVVVQPTEIAKAR